MIRDGGPGGRPLPWRVAGDRAQGFVLIEDATGRAVAEVEEARHDYDAALWVAQHIVDQSNMGAPGPGRAPATLRDRFDAWTRPLRCRLGRHGRSCWGHPRCPRRGGGSR